MKRDGKRTGVDIGEKVFEASSMVVGGETCGR